MRKETLVIRTAKALMDWTKMVHRAGKTIGLVPTMGYLHEAHMSLVRVSQTMADITIVTDYVNPTQFGPTEDFATYPRDEAHDLALCEKEGVDVLFIPDTKEIYPFGQRATYVDMHGLSDLYCGANRPGHFRGVCTVVAKLLNMSRADFAIFGQKDYQQWTIIKRMAYDLGMDVEIVGSPTIRESDGLAMSSRNVRLSTEGRAVAPVIYEALCAIRDEVEKGVFVLDALRSIADAVFGKAPNLLLEYLHFADAHSLAPIEGALEGDAVVLVAARLDGVRLIDNMPLEWGHIKAKKAN